MLGSFTRSQRSFLRKCASVIIIAIFLTLLLYSLLDRITNRFNYYFTWCNSYLSSFLLSSGFSIDEAVITGNKFTDKKDILSLVDKTQPIMYISLSRLADNIRSVSRWIKNVRIYRTLPNTLHINIDEHKPFALWEDDNRISVIDYEGKVITDGCQIDNLVLITGQDSLSNLEFVQDILKSKTQLRDHISSCIYVGGRRWNVVLDNGSTVKLPEDAPNRAWDYLSHLQNTTDFTFSDWSIIDMRIIDKIFVKR